MSILDRILEWLRLRKPAPPFVPPGPVPPKSGTIADVLARMEAIGAEVGPDDGVGWFNRLYLEVTQRVAAFDRSGPQAAPGFLERLDVAFADLYFAAYAAAGTAPALPPGFPYNAWEPLFEERKKRDIAPIQFALAGMNAHINHDLALGICDVCIERGVRPRRGSPEHRDYQAVNPLIADAEKAVKSWLMTGVLAELDRTFRPVDDIVAVWSVERARAAAWTRAEVLWHLRYERAVRDEYVEINDRAVELTSRALLTPVGLA
ncbi:MAG: DUF5995 family protein [Actinomycetota bacterium]|nr:DUF5995 family protein [Actinomycetota bacterium]